MDDSPCGLGKPGENGEQDYMHLNDDWTDLGDVNGEPFPNCPPAFSAYWSIIEYSADCNGDGIVDYGQILDGTLIDKNGNGIPDCCEFNLPCLPEPCPGDLNNDGVVNGADIAVLLGFWGLNGKPVDADITGDGLVDGADLAMLLSSWGACP
jgi:hypothetical protein